MVKLWRLVGYRVKVPPEVPIYEFLEEIAKISICAVAEELAIPNHYAVVVREGMAPKFEEYFRQKGYDYLPADIHFKTKLRRRR